MNKSGKKYPVQNGDKIEISISDMNHQGEGVGRYEGLAVFVPFALPGDLVEVQVEQVKSSYARASVLRFFERSPYFNQSCCSIFEKCGGCHLQHYDYNRQLEFKRNIVRNALQRIGKLEGVTVYPTIGMTKPYAYRNKAEYPIKMIDGVFKSGFFSPKSHSLVAIDEICPIQHPLLEKARKAFLGLCNQPEIREELKKSGFHHLIIRAGINTGEIMVIAVVEKPVSRLEDLAKRLICTVPEVVSFYQKVSGQGKKKSKGEFRLVAGKASIRERIDSLNFDISPGSFFQVNSAQAEVLFSKAIEYAACTGVAVDAYCGTGSISLFLAKSAKKVYGFELYPDAVNDARHNAFVNGVKNIEFIQGDAGDTLKKLCGVKPETVVIDPPRRGCSKKALEGIVALHPEKIVYVSCNPATLARDLKFLSERDYAVVKAQPIDMFPQTHHVECVVLMSRAKD